MPETPHKPPLGTYYLLDKGHPFLAVISSVEARALYDAAEPETRTGDMIEGFEYSLRMENGVGHPIIFTTRVSPIPASQLARIVRQVSRFTKVPAELTVHAA